MPERPSEGWNHPQSIGARIAAAAAARGGPLTTERLCALGLSPTTINRWVADGRLFPRYRGVYAVGRRAMAPVGEWRAALDAIGDDSWIADTSAVELWGWRRGFTMPIQVGTTRSGLRQRPGLRIHHTRVVPNLTSRQGLRVTTAAATLADMAAHLTDGQLIRLCGQAAFAGHYDRGALLRELRPHRRGAPRLRRVLATLDVGGGHTHSNLEDALRVLIARHGIRPPRFNEDIGPFIADAVWWDVGLVIELDSRSAHDNEPAFFSDREKDLHYAELGLECLRLTWRHVVEQEARVARLLLTRVGNA